MSNVRTHVTHCCALHGCKYGYKSNCPVVAGEHAQEFRCEECPTVAELKQQMEELKVELAFAEKLVALKLARDNA